MHIIDDSDEAIQAVAHPTWDDLIKYSNNGQRAEGQSRDSDPLTLSPFSHT